MVVNGVVSVVVLAACFYAYTMLGERKRPSRSKPNKPAATVVLTEPLRVHDGPVSVQANGVVVPLREIRLATEVAGRVVEQSSNLRNGRMVQAGETLIQLDRTEFEIEVKRLNAQQGQEAAELASIDVSIENTQQVMALAEQQLEIAQGERERVSSLVQRQAASSSEVDVAKRSELSSRSALVELQNRRRELIAQRQLVVEKQALTQVALERAQLDLDRTTIRSPLRGRVVASSVEEQSFLPVGTSFVTIEDTSAVEVRANLTAEQMVWVWSSQASTTQAESDQAIDDRVPPLSATVEYQFGAQARRYDARLERIDGAGIDLDTRTYPCLFRVESGTDQDDSTVTDPLMRGTFVSVTIHTVPTRRLHEVPESAIRPGNRLWLNVGDQLTVQEITIVSRSEDQVIVDLGSSLTPLANQRAPGVIVSPISDPVPGMALANGGVLVKDAAFENKTIKDTTTKETTATEKAAG
ncbi:Inner membrane protein YiaV precursor [Neorhodopirellula pilleata]|uniref:Inner membrane protein YiaV n=1 Tax=Neorhodopirellula pilleata TaxID=2714738 RepID=A0A5C6A8W9_9BACT|nr:Inner membrane protein YiaV precursor [Neorhodopirellula pilleata]